MKEKVRATVTHILAIAVMRSVFTRIATPGESAALGAIACYILAALNRKRS